MQNRSPIDTSTFEPRTFIPANPAAGADLNYNVPTNRRILPVSIQLTLVTDANVANRRVGLVFHDGSNAFIEVEAAQGETASTTHIYYWLTGGFGQYNSTGLSSRVNCLPENLWLDDTAAIQTNIQNIQVGDQISDIFIRALSQILE